MLMDQRDRSVSEAFYAKGRPETDGRRTVLYNVQLTLFILFYLFSNMGHLQPGIRLSKAQ